MAPHYQETSKQKNDLGNKLAPVVGPDRSLLALQGRHPGSLRKIKAQSVSIFCEVGSDDRCWPYLNQGTRRSQYSTTSFQYDTRKEGAGVYMNRTTTAFATCLTAWCSSAPGCTDLKAY